MKYGKFNRKYTKMYGWGSFFQVFFSGDNVFFLEYSNCEASRREIEWKNSNSYKNFEN